MAIGLVLFIWAGLVVLFQCLGWLKFAIWQPVPVLALMMNAEAQGFALRMFNGFPNALDLIPALGGPEPPTLFGDGMKGVEKIFIWLIHLPMFIWLAVAGSLAFAIGGTIQGEER